ncbi:MAG: electron transfer flavoprotein subunit beta/FixA family protein [Deltaproteobacteria bacterium]|nr:electron transfer flavoprotein subunit beta/FixA family protein [Deltaproteobacteria bacterium]
MKIGVLVKQVPDTATKIVLTANGRGIEEGNVKWVMNPYDEYAVEAALRLQGPLSAEVVVFSLGPARAVETLRMALAMGCDRAVRIHAETPLDAFATGNALAVAIAASGCELVFGGKQAVDDDAGQVLQIVAEVLHWPVVSVANQLHVHAGNDGITVHRPAAGGVTEVVELGFPAVIGCDKGLNTPRYPSLPGIMKAKQKPLTEQQSRDLLGGVSPHVVLQQFSLPPDRPAGRKITGDPENVAQQLVDWLHNEIKVI